MEKEKKISILNIILILIIIGLGCYIAYDKVMDNKKNNINNNENINEGNENIKEENNENIKENNEDVNEEDNEDVKENKEEEVKEENKSEAKEENKEEVKDDKLYHIEKLDNAITYEGYQSNKVFTTGEISFDYPVIDIDSDEIKKVNAEILKIYCESYLFEESKISNGHFFKLYKNSKSYGTTSDIKSAKYYISEGSNYLSIIIGIEDNHIVGESSLNYIGYVINKKTKKIMSNKEILELFNATKDENAYIKENNQDYMDTKANSIEDLKLYVYNDKIVLCYLGGSGLSEMLMVYNNGTFKNYSLK